jgi:hypothetical protein
MNVTRTVLADGTLLALAACGSSTGSTTANTPAVPSSTASASAVPSVDAGTAGIVCAAFNSMTFEGDTGADAIATAASATTVPLHSRNLQPKQATERGRVRLAFTVQRITIPSPSRSRHDPPRQHAVAGTGTHSRASQTEQRLAWSTRFEFVRSSHGKLVGLGDHAGVRDDGDVGQLVGCYELPDDRHRRPTSRARSSPSTSRRARCWNSPSGRPCGWATTTSGPSTSCSRWQNSRPHARARRSRHRQGGCRSPHHRRGSRSGRMRAEATGRAAQRPVRLSRRLSSRQPQGQPASHSHLKATTSAIPNLRPPSAPQIIPICTPTRTIRPPTPREPRSAALARPLPCKRLPWPCADGSRVQAGPDAVSCGPGCLWLGGQYWARAADFVSRENSLDGA